jgi:hypothetical protein
LTPSAYILDKTHLLPPPPPKEKEQVPASQIELPNNQAAPAPGHTTNNRPRGLNQNRNNRVKETQSPNKPGSFTTSWEEKGPLNHHASTGIKRTIEAEGNEPSAQHNMTQQNLTQRLVSPASLPHTNNRSSPPHGKISSCKQQQTRAGKLAIGCTSGAASENAYHLDTKRTFVGGGNKPSTSPSPSLSLCLPQHTVSTPFCSQNWSAALHCSECIIIKYTPPPPPPPSANCRTVPSHVSTDIGMVRSTLFSGGLLCRRCPVCLRIALHLPQHALEYGRKGGAVRDVPYIGPELSREPEPAYEENDNFAGHDSLPLP